MGERSDDDLEEGAGDSDASLDDQKGEEREEHTPEQGGEEKEEEGSGVKASTEEHVHRAKADANSSGDDSKESDLDEPRGWGRKQQRGQQKRPASAALAKRNTFPRKKKRRH